MSKATLSVRNSSNLTSGFATALRLPLPRTWLCATWRPTYRRLKKALSARAQGRRLSKSEEDELLRRRITLEPHQRPKPTNEHIQMNNNSALHLNATGHFQTTPHCRSSIDPYILCSFAYRFSLNASGQSSSKITNAQANKLMQHAMGRTDETCVQSCIPRVPHVQARILQISNEIA